MNFSQERIYKALNEKNAIQRYLSRRFFNFSERAGFHILADHFYEPIPNTNDIAKNYKDEPRSCHNIDFDFERAEETIVKLIEKWGHEFIESVTKYGYKEANYYFRGVDALFLYCFLRETKPKSIVEVGQGVSTGITLAALEDNYQVTGIKTKFISIDPYNRLDLQGQSLAGIEFKEMPLILQAVPLDLFSDLQESDLLFIDSSHIYKFGSDVEYLFEEIYPRINRGVYIHIHDICSPYHYPLDWYVSEKRFWNEQYYLENFLRYNTTFTVKIPVYYLTRKSSKLKAICELICQYNDFQRQGASFYLRKEA